MLLVVSNLLRERLVFCGIWVKFVRSQITKVEGIASYFDTFGI
jgi:hypothetical protein